MIQLLQCFAGVFVDIRFALSAKQQGIVRVEFVCACAVLFGFILAGIGLCLVNVKHDDTTDNHSC